MVSWRKTSYGSWMFGEWIVRPITMGLRPMFWVYYKGTRYTETGHYDDSVHFFTLKAAKEFVETKENEK